MSDLDSTTRLSAINGMLATIGEAPVNSLENTALLDVAVAKAALDEVTRAVLVDGWAFNTDEAYPLTPEGFSPFAIHIPPNALVCLPTPEFRHITPRGSRLYDTERLSFDFEGFEKVTCRMIWKLPFDELPEVTRQYVAIKAARLFQARTTASELLHQFTNADEQMARWVHQRNNVRTRRRNFLTDSYAASGILSR